MATAAYSKDFNPILLPGETASLFGPDFPTDGLPMKCVAYGPLPEYIHTFSALTASTWLTDQQVTNLEMPTFELGQFRMRVLFDGMLRLKNPSSVDQWRSLSNRFNLSTWPADESDDLRSFLFRASEFFIWENENTPRFDLWSTAVQALPYVWFGGWRIRMKKMAAGEHVSAMNIWVNSWPAGS